MKVVFFSLMTSFVTLIWSPARASQSNHKNYECQIFRTVEGTPAKGSLTLFGEEFNRQNFNVSISENGKALKHYEGKVNLVAFVKFTALDSDAQDALMNVVDSSERSNLESGDFYVFSNGHQRSDTLRVFLKRGGKIGFLQVGGLDVLCM